MTRRRIVRDYSRQSPFGLDEKGNPVWNRTDGVQLTLDASSTSGVATFVTVLPNGTQTVSGSPVKSGGVYTFDGGVTAQGDLTGVNVVASGDVTASGDIAGTDIAAAGNVTGLDITASGDIYAGNNVTAEDNVLADTLVLSAVSGEGILLNRGSPAYPWQDKEGILYPDATAGPVRGQFRTGLYQYAFSNGKEMDFSFHMPHDLVIGLPMYIHVHWAHNADTTATGNVVFNFKISHAKGHNRENFSVPISPTISYAMVNIATTPQYRHRIDEIQLTASSPTAAQLDADEIDVDGLIIGTITVDLSGATLTTSTPANSIYIFTIDLHYQSTGIGTLNKEPSFHGEDSYSGTGSMSAGGSSLTGTGTRVGSRSGTAALLSGPSSISGVGTRQEATGSLLSGAASLSAVGTRVGARTGTAALLSAPSTLSATGTSS